MAGLIYPLDDLTSAAGSIPNPKSVTAASGLGNLAESPADVGRVTQQTLSSIRNMGVPSSAMPPMPAAAPAPTIAYSKSTNKMFVNGQTFDARDALAADQASAYIRQPTGAALPQDVPDWQPLSPEGFTSYLNELKQPRGMLSNLALGARGIAEGTIGGIGRAAELAGSDTVGPGIAEFADKTFGQDKFEQSRSALIQKSNPWYSNLGGAVVQGIPSIAASIGAGVGGFAAGGPAGAFAGVAASVFFPELQGMYESAQKNGFDTSDPDVKGTMMVAALGSTVLQSIAPGRIASGLSPVLRDQITKAATQAAEKRLVGWSRSGEVAKEVLMEGATEGTAEAVSSLLQNVVFDPEVRKNLSPMDIKVLLPHLIEKGYAEEAAIAFGAGAILGGAFGGAGKYYTSGKGKEVGTTEPADLMGRAGQPAPEGAPPGTPPVAGLLTYQQMGNPSFWAQPDAMPTPGNRFWDDPVWGYNPPPEPQRLLTGPAPTPPARPAPDTRGLALFDQAPFIPGGQAELFPGAPQQRAPQVTPPAGPAVQMNLPLEGPQQNLPLVGGSNQAFQNYTPMRETPLQQITPSQFQGYQPLQERPLEPIVPQSPQREAAGPMATDKMRALQTRLEQQARERAKTPDMEAAYAQREASAPAPDAQWNDALVQAATQEATPLPVNGADTKNKIQNQPRRNILHGFNRLTGEQQNRIYTALAPDGALEASNEDVLAYVRKMPPAAARAKLAEVAGVSPEHFTKTAPEPSGEAPMPTIIQTPFGPGKKLPLQPLEPASVPKPKAARKPLKTAKKVEIVPAPTPAPAPVVAAPAPVAAKAPVVVVRKPLKNTSSASGPPAGVKPAPAPTVPAPAVKPQGRGTLSLKKTVEPVAETKPVAPKAEALKMPRETPPPKKSEGAAAAPSAKAEPAADVSPEKSAKPVVKVELSRALSAKHAHMQALVDAAETGDTEAFAANVDEIVEQALFPANSNDYKGNDAPVAAALDVLVSVSRQIEETGNTELRAKINESIVAQASQTAEGRRRPVVHKDALQPWFVYLQKFDLINAKSGPSISTTQLAFPESPETRAKFGLEDLYRDRLQQQKAAAERAKVTSDTVEKAPESNAFTDLFDKLASMTSVVDYMKTRGDVNRAYKRLELGGGDTNVLINGHPLKNYFGGTKSDPALNVQKDETTGQYVAYAKDPKSGEIFPATTSFDKQGRFMLADGSPGKPLGAGRVKLAVAGITSKMRAAPKVHVFSDVDDLRTRNPALYKKAAAARLAGDFDTARAAGYSFGDNVILFGDNIHSDQELRFVLAHEAIGHYGFQAVVAKRDLDSTLDKIYASNRGIAARVDDVAQLRGIPRREAIEEVLADYAAHLDTSVLARIWNVVKNAANKIGIKFEDDMARMLVSQARRYIRYGDGSFFSADRLKARLQELATEAFNGRFDLMTDSATLASQSATSRAMSGLSYGSRLISNLREGHMATALKDIASKSTNVSETLRAALSHVQTLNMKAFKNSGLTEIYHLFKHQTNVTKTLLNKYNQITQYTHSVNWDPRVKFAKTDKHAPTNGDRDVVNSALANARIASLHRKEKVDYLSLPSLLDKNGEIDEAAVKQITDEYGFTRKQFADGLEEFDPLTKTTNKLPKIEMTDAQWKMYQEQRTAMNRAALDKVMAQQARMSNQHESMLRRLSSLETATKEKFTFDDEVALRRITQQYRKLERASHKLTNNGVETDHKAKQKAEDFLIEVTRVFSSNQKLQDWVKASPEEKASKFQGPEYQDIIDSLDKLARVRITQENVYKMQKMIRDIALVDYAVINEMRTAQVTIADNYAPLVREGKYEVRQTAWLKDGTKPVRLDDDFHSKMYYGREASKDDALKVADELHGAYNENGKPRYYTVKDTKGDLVDVEFRFEVNSASQLPELGPVMNYTDFMYMLDRLNVSITPAARERLTIALTKQGANARARLRADANPGWRPDMIRGISEKLEEMAHASSKIMYRHRIEDVMLNKNLFQGDSYKLEGLKRAYEAAKKADPHSAATKGALREYETYAKIYAESAAITAGRPDFIEVNGTKLPLRGRGKEAHEEALKIIAWYNESNDIVSSTEGMLSSGIGSSLKTATVAAHLGGVAPAAAALNVLSLPTNSLNYLATYNPKNGFGGGFGYAKAAKAIMQSVQNVAAPSFGDAEHLAKIIKEKSWAKYGLNEREAVFLHAESETGNLSPALSDTLLASARGVQNDRVASMLKTWMSMFSYTEQFARRVTALAAYRLHYDRALAEGKAGADAHVVAKGGADDALRFSQGDYNMYDRPEAFRGHLMQYVFMYKMFTLVTINLLAKMPPAGKLAFLAMLMALSGIKGLPFADDIMDLVDTAAQKFGIPMQGVERHLYQFFEAMLPGSGVYMMRGLFDQSGATVSTRTGFGDVVPLTGAFRAGADPWREASDFAGPVFSVAAGLAAWSGSIASYGGSVVGLNSKTSTFNDLLRESPISTLRSIGDAIAYTDAGAIVNARGQVISRDLTASAVILRALGFYPAEATRHHDAIRTAKFSSEYDKAIKKEFIEEYTKAAVSGDTARMRQVVTNVNEWNEDARGTGFEVNNFLQSATRAAREAQRPASERFLKTLPKELRRDTDQIMKLYGYEI